MVEWVAPIPPGGREAVEHLDELQLVVEVVLEPQRDFIMRKRIAEFLVSLPERGLDVRKRTPSSLGNESRALLRELRERKAGAHRPFVKNVLPGQHFTGELPQKKSGGDVAVGDVQQR